MSAEIPIRTQQLIINFYLSRPFLKISEIAFKLSVDINEAKTVIDDYQKGERFVIYHSEMNNPDKVPDHSKYFDFVENQP